MNLALLNIQVRKLHKWLALILSFQIGLWFISGFVMTIFPIEEVRGSHLRNELPKQVIDLKVFKVSLKEIQNDLDEKIITASAMMVLDIPTWRISTEEGDMLFNAETGKALTPLNEELAKNIASKHYSGEGELLKAEFHNDAPREAPSKAPLWAIHFGKEDKAIFYINSETAELRAVRTDLWRVFDFFWGLHIMDWDERDNFNSWWLISTVSVTLLFFLSGLLILLMRIRFHLAHK